MRCFDSGQHDTQVLFAGGVSIGTTLARTLASGELQDRET
jgi:hypothetical protein